MKQLLRIVFLSLFFSVCAVSMHAQKISLKSNALDWLFLTPNFGIEFTFTKHISLDLAAGYSPFEFDNFSTGHFTFTPEIKYWLGMPSIAHAVGCAATVSYGHLTLKDKHLDGLVAGFGPTYTYAWILGEHWNFELTGGIGCYYYTGFRYDSDNPETAEPNISGWIAGPLKFGATFVYLMK